MSTILVTGGAGYIGSHACKALADAGHIPICYDSLERGHKWSVKWGPLEQGNILDRQNLLQVINDYKPDAIMHFAAYAYVGESVEWPDMYHKNNVEGSRVLLESMQESGIDKIIFSSSCATYGMPVQLPITEDHPQQPINPYGETKLATESLLREFNNKFGIRFISLRYFNAAGADADGVIGEQHDPETHLIPLALDVAMGRREMLEIYGNDYPTTDGTCIRDYIHVTDVSSAHVSALTSLLNNDTTTMFYNLGTETGASVQEVVSTAEKITGQNIPVKISGRRKGDPPELVASCEKIRKELGWVPEQSSLENILQTAWQWHQEKLKYS